MGRAEWIRLYRYGLALLTLVAVGWQFVDGAGGPDFRPANFFSFFTIQSNLFAAAVFLYGAMRDPAAPPPRWLDGARGAATLYLSITGVVYGLLLSGYQEELQTTIPWVDTALHRVMPLAVVVDWLLDPPRRPPTFRAALPWLLYPVAYCAYSLLRGPLVDWYPYPFLDPDAAGGYGVVALYCLGIAVGALAFCWAVVALGRRVRLTT